MESVMNAVSEVSRPDSHASRAVAQRTAALTNASELVGRFLLALLFLLSGLGKIGAYGATAAYMSSAGVPGALLPAVIAVEVLGGLALVLGWKTRIAAALLAGFSLLAAVTFHNNLADQIQLIMFFKNVAIAGGLLILVANGAGPLSVDRRVAR
jgi:putative oxidoreductase